MINLEKKEKSNSFENLAEDDLQSINRQKIRENTRIFIPCSELPNDNDERCKFLDGMVHFMEKETGRHYLYISANETALYEMKGFYIQAKTENEAIDSNYDTVKSKTSVLITVCCIILIAVFIILMCLLFKQLFESNNVTENIVQESTTDVTSTAANDETFANSQTDILNSLIWVFRKLARILLPVSVEIVLTSIAIECIRSLIRRLNRK